MKKIILMVALIISFADAQNFSPLHIGNSYQYLVQKSGFYGDSIFLSNKYITQDTIANSIKYFLKEDFSYGPNWERYDSTTNVLSGLCGGADETILNFNRPNDVFFGSCFLYPWGTAYYSEKNANYFGQSFHLQGYYIEYHNWCWGSYWGSEIGVMEGGEWWSNDTTSSVYEKLIEAVLYSDSSNTHWTYNYPASIQCIQNDLENNNLSFYLSVNHPFTHISPKFTYIDKILLNGYYKKDNDIISIDSLIFSYPGTDTRLFKMDLTLDTFYLNNGYTFYYKAIAKDKGLIPVYTSYPDTGYLSKTILSVNDKRELVSNFSLSQNYPNPFNPSTNIQYYIPSECRINVTVYNALGAKVKELVNGTEPMGSYEVKFDGTGLASGIYFVTLKAASTDGKQSFVSSKKMILMK